MITEERLKELIQQRATIWCSSWEEEVNLSPENCVIDDLCIREVNFREKRLLVLDDDKKTALHSYRLQFLEEDVETEKFKLEFQNITRTETLSLPTFEELKKLERFDFKAKDGHVYTIHFISDFKTLAITGIIENKYYGEAAKENYLEACKIAKKLFLGEK